MHSTAFFVIAIIAIVAQAYLLVLFFFEPGLRYKLSTPENSAVETPEFLHELEALTDARVRRHTDIQVLTNGESFYQAELEAITGAQETINLEAYIFQTGDVTSRFLRAMTERARQGVKVKLLLDAVGSAGTFKSEIAALREAGGKFAWYHPLWWHTIPNFNNRTHRELLIVDSRIGFAGGAGFADHWLHARPKHPRWRDTMLRFEGDVVTSLQATFAENWLESTGEVLAGHDYFPCLPAAAGEGETEALVVASTPTVGGSTRARVLFQLLISSARESIHITTPYFLPDAGARHALMKAAKERGVDVRILVPGRHSDHFQTRSSSRRFYGPLLQAGVRIFEYEPSMIHAKMMVVDGLWSVVGSTNLDPRSFRINDEVNVAIRGREVAARLGRDFAADLANSRQVTYETWRRRNVLQRLDETVGVVLERLE
ncbi:MAG TPA: phospholipase D-like domain-containing protein [Terriglobales bacterium]|nr:phospholipase D-like domain-containing protein [Terriglobales bacterium]